MTDKNRDTPIHSLGQALKVNLNYLWLSKSLNYEFHKKDPNKLTTAVWSVGPSAPITTLCLFWGLAPLLDSKMNWDYDL